MIKEMYIIRGSKNEDYPNFKDRIFKTASTILEEVNPEALKVTLTTAAPPVISLIPFKKLKIAVFSVYRTKNGRIDMLLNDEGLSNAFKVDEAIPVHYEKDWPDGEASPGPCLLTLFRRKPGIDYDTFINRWHNGHTPLTLKLHPLCNYNRNVVLQKLCDSDGWWDGIVEEQTQTRSELLNPFKFFGNGLKAFGNMIEVYRDTNSFLEYKTIETYLTTEYHIRSSHGRVTYADVEHHEI